MQFHELGSDDILTLVAQGWELIEDNLGQWLYDGVRYEAIADGQIQQMISDETIMRDPARCDHKLGVVKYRLTRLGVQRAGYFTDTLAYRIAYPETNVEESWYVSALVVGVLVVILLGTVIMMAVGLTCF